MDDVDLENSPQTGKRPDYRRLKADNTFAEQTPENDSEQARQEGERKLAAQSAAGTVANPLLALIQMIVAFMQGWPSGENHSRDLIVGQPLSTFRDRYTPEDMKNKQVFIAPRKTEDVEFAAELPTGLKGLTQDDSYLFITKDESDGKIYRAYLVSKNDPGKRQEIKVTGADLPDAAHKRLDVHLQGGHEFAVDLTGYRLDGNEIRTIGQRDGIEQDQHIVDRLVKRRVMVGNARANVSSNDDIVVRGDFDGDKWTFWQKDIRSGQILKFTQSDKDPTKGALEVIQGDAVSFAQERSMSHGIEGSPEQQRESMAASDQVRHDWLDNGETKRAPISSSGNLVEMPESMKEQAVFDTGNARANMALEKVIGDPAAVERHIKEENHKWVVQQNAHEVARTRPQPSFPKP